MTYAASIVLSLAVAAAIIFPYTWNEEINPSKGRMLLIWAFVGVVAGLMVALMDVLPLGGVEKNRWLVVGLVVSTCGAVAYGAMGHLRFFLRVKRVGLLLRDQTDPAAREGLADRLEEMLKAHLSRKPRTKAERRSYASCVFQVVAQFNEAGLFSRSRRLLEEMPEPETHSAEWQVYRSAQSIGALYEGEPERARELFFAIPRPGKTPAIEAILAANEAFFLVLEGKLKEALRIVGEERDPAADPTLARTRDLVRAHVYAAQGDHAQARALLVELRERWNATVLLRAVLSGGPAAGIARDLMAERGDPYR